jgi:hypothetical protein
MTPHFCPIYPWFSNPSLDLKRSFPISNTVPYVVFYRTIVLLLHEKRHRVPRSFRISSLAEKIIPSVADFNHANQRQMLLVLPL